MEIAPNLQLWSADHGDGYGNFPTLQDGVQGEHYWNMRDNVRRHEK
jgi:hypothetical protein